MQKKPAKDNGLIVKNAGYAPYLNYQPLKEADQALIEPVLEQSWLLNDIEAQAAAYAIAHIVPQHLQEVKQRQMRLYYRVRLPLKLTNHVIRTVSENCRTLKFKTHNFEEE